MVTPDCVEDLPVCGRMRPDLIDDNWLATTFNSIVVERNPFDPGAQDAYRAILDWPKVKNGESVIARYKKDGDLRKIQDLGIYRSLVEAMIENPEIVLEYFCKEDEKTFQSKIRVEQEIVSGLNQAFSARAGARWFINPKEAND
ncbi:MAG: hypothetical protein GYA55_09000 [SAR324 cluster bacterium]|uniref:Uncharacterized protein n=1 Tax=SAR324 cluster bacterium TaxID=2024889 RepID=A0A7X9FS29_9DELT|nr:hypothetical protein [SAR324 cluster bacterium]